MTTKKTSTKRRRPTVKARALAIIAGGVYDEETRHAVKNALEEKGTDLAEIVRRAEAGETVLDVSSPLGGVPADDDLGAFAYHLSEVLRIARTNPLISAGFYNELANAWNNSANEILNVTPAFWESEAYIRLALDTYTAVKAEQAADGEQ